MYRNSFFFAFVKFCLGLLFGLSLSFPHLRGGSDHWACLVKWEITLTSVIVSAPHWGLFLFSQRAETLQTWREFLWRLYFHGTDSFVC